MNRSGKKNNSELCRKPNQIKLTLNRPSLGDFIQMTCRKITLEEYNCEEIAHYFTYFYTCSHLVIPWFVRIINFFLALSSQITVVDRPMTQQGLGGMKTGVKGTDISFIDELSVKYVIHFI